MHTDLESARRLLEPIWTRYDRSAEKPLALRSVGFRHGRDSAPARILENDEKVVVECDAAGCRPEDVSIALNGRVLRISVRGPRPIEESIYVPVEVELAGMRAELLGDRLQITLPARQAARGPRGLGAAWYRKAT